MKTTHKTAIWMVLAFLSTAFFLSSCEPEVKILPVVTIGSAENITPTSATLVAYVTPNGEATASFEYQANSSAWVATPLLTGFIGDEAIKVTFELQDLQPGTTYNFKVNATNADGSNASALASFTTPGLPASIIRLEGVSDLTLNSAKLIAWVTPMQDVRVAFRVKGVTESVLPTIFSGTDSLKVTFDLLDLELNTEYKFYVETLNQKDEVVSTSDTVLFKTYAVSDYDGNLYHTVTIGTQTWLQENFKGTHFANGDPIPNIQDSAQWANQISPAYCYYDNDPANGEVYGGLYNWYVASDSRGLITGYHTASEPEWRTLQEYTKFGDIDHCDWNLSGHVLKEAGNAHWIQNYGVSNSTGFTALPGGVRSLYRFSGITNGAQFWSSTVFPVSGVAYIFTLNARIPDLSSAGNYYTVGQSIRLVKN